MFNAFFSSRARGSWIPDVDVVDSADHYRIYVDLPDVQKSDVRVDTEGGSVVCISGNRVRRLSDEDQRNLIVAERDYGRFERCFDLPTAINESKVKASFADQVLSIELPKMERSASSSASKAVRIE